MKLFSPFLFCGIIVTSCQFLKPAAHFFVSNLSEVNKQVNISILVDGEIVFKKVVEFDPENDSSLDKFDLHLSRGNHLIQVIADSGRLSQRRDALFRRDNRIAIIYRAANEIGPKTKKPLTDGSLSRNLSLEVSEY